jgi:hypothetical protein
MAHALDEGFTPVRGSYLLAINEGLSISEGFVFSRSGRAKSAAA